MGMGRGSSSFHIEKVAVLAILVILCSSVSFSLAATHVVGGAQGWGFSVSYADWANGHTFTQGDTLVFNYQAGLHNVVPVSAAGHRSCKATGESGMAAAAVTGNDKFTLKKGANYFICSVPGHCAAGMKIEVNAV